MKLSDFINGLKILQSYYNQDYCIGAEHDIFYTYATDKPLSSEDIVKMVEYGWHQDVYIKDGEFATKDYDPEEGWQAFV